MVTNDADVRMLARHSSLRNNPHSKEKLLEFRVILLSCLLLGLVGGLPFSLLHLQMMNVLLPTIKTDLFMILLSFFLHLVILSLIYVGLSLLSVLAVLFLVLGLTWSYWQFLKAFIAKDEEARESISLVLNRAHQPWLILKKTLMLLQVRLILVSLEFLVMLQGLLNQSIFRSSESLTTDAIFHSYQQLYDLLATDPKQAFLLNLTWIILTIIVTTWISKELSVLMYDYRFPTRLRIIQGIFISSSVYVAQVVLFSPTSWIHPFLSFSYVFYALGLFLLCLQIVSFVLVLQHEKMGRIIGRKSSWPLRLVLGVHALFLGMNVIGVLMKALADYKILLIPHDLLTFVFVIFLAQIMTMLLGILVVSLLSAGVRVPFQDHLQEFFNVAFPRKLLSIEQVKEGRRARALARSPFSARRGFLEALQFIITTLSRMGNSVISVIIGIPIASAALVKIFLNTVTRPDDVPSFLVLLSSTRGTVATLTTVFLRDGAEAVYRQDLFELMMRGSVLAFFGLSILIFVLDSVRGYQSERDRSFILKDRPFMTISVTLLTVTHLPSDIPDMHAFLYFLLTIFWHMLLFLGLVILTPGQVLWGLILTFFVLSPLLFPLISRNYLRGVEHQETSASSPSPIQFVLVILEQSIVFLAVGVIMLFTFMLGPDVAIIISGQSPVDINQLFRENRPLVTLLQFILQVSALVFLPAIVWDLRKDETEILLRVRRKALYRHLRRASGHVIIFGLSNFSQNFLESLLRMPDSPVIVKEPHYSLPGYDQGYQLVSNVVLVAEENVSPSVHDEKIRHYIFGAESSIEFQNVNLGLLEIDDPRIQGRKLLVPLLLGDVRKWETLQASGIERSRFIISCLDDDDFSRFLAMVTEPYKDVKLILPVRDVHEHWLVSSILDEEEEHATRGLSILLPSEEGEWMAFHLNMLLGGMMSRRSHVETASVAPSEDRNVAFLFMSEPDDIPFMYFRLHGELKDLSVVPHYYILDVDFNCLNPDETPLNRPSDQRQYIIPGTKEISMPLIHVHGFEKLFQHLINNQSISKVLVAVSLDDSAQRLKVINHLFMTIEQQQKPDEVLSIGVVSLLGSQKEWSLLKSTKKPANCAFIGIQTKELVLAHYVAAFQGMINQPHFFLKACLCSDKLEGYSELINSIVIDNNTRDSRNPFLVRQEPRERAHAVRIPYLQAFPCSGWSEPISTSSLVLATHQNDCITGSGNEEPENENGDHQHELENLGILKDHVLYREPRQGKGGILDRLVTLLGEVTSRNRCHQYYGHCQVCRTHLRRTGEIRSSSLDSFKRDSCYSDENNARSVSHGHGMRNHFQVMYIHFLNIPRAIKTILNEMRGNKHHDADQDDGNAVIDLTYLQVDSEILQSRTSPNRSSNRVDKEIFSELRVEASIYGYELRHWKVPRGLNSCCLVFSILNFSHEESSSSLLNFFDANGTSLGSHAELTETALSFQELQDILPMHFPNQFFQLNISFIYNWWKLLFTIHDHHVNRRSCLTEPIEKYVWSRRLHGLSNEQVRLEIAKMLFILGFFLFLGAPHYRPFLETEVKHYCESWTPSNQAALVSELWNELRFLRAHLPRSLIQEAIVMVISQRGYITKWRQELLHELSSLGFLKKEHRHVTLDKARASGNKEIYYLIARDVDHHLLAVLSHLVTLVSLLDQ